MTNFTISSTPCTIGFRTHVNLNILSPIELQLQRHKLIHRVGPYKGNPFEIKKIIEQNASLRVDFGWSFESSNAFETIMKECIQDVSPKFNIAMNDMVSDFRCSWLGFVPYNIFEQIVYEDLSVYGLIIFNNELINFQTDVIKFITEHTIFKNHAILRDSRFRFEYFKALRKNPVALVMLDV